MKCSVTCMPPLPPVQGFWKENAKGPLLPHLGQVGERQGGESWLAVRCSCSSFQPE